ncbi:MAG TPA: 16S rRNA (cytosine(1402)-N(4))-methyltransferase, partial [Candidatus Dormibacteraeota bacterium]|nr:16S rRNA (cytosine(1402)-N(4))-methyltransferase [Candidatus Dormibacteraeota bacterium]
MRRKRHERGERHDNRKRHDSRAVAGRGAAEGEPSAFKREASGGNAQEPEHVNAHIPVLLDEVTFLLRPRRGGWVVDGTIGMGGHAEQLLETAGGESRLLGI